MRSKFLQHHHAVYSVKSGAYCQAHCQAQGGARGRPARFLEKYHFAQPMRVRMPKVEKTTFRAFLCRPIPPPPAWRCRLAVPHGSAAIASMSVAPPVLLGATTWGGWLSP